MQNTKLWYGIQNTKILKARWNAKCKIQTNRKLVGIKQAKYKPVANWVEFKIQNTKLLQTRCNTKYEIES